MCLLVTSCKKVEQINSQKKKKKGGQTLLLKNMKNSFSYIYKILL